MFVEVGGRALSRSRVGRWLSARDGIRCSWEGRFAPSEAMCRSEAQAFEVRSCNCRLCRPFEPEKGLAESGYMKNGTLKVISDDPGVVRNGSCPNGQPATAER